MGKKQVAAMLGMQTLRASTRPRPFLRLSPQHLAVQARPVSDAVTNSLSVFISLSSTTLSCKRNKATSGTLRHERGACMRAMSRAARCPARCCQPLKRSTVHPGSANQPQPREAAAAARRRRRASKRASSLRPSSAS